MSCGSVKKKQMEGYADGTSVCDTQADFNVAVQEAIKYNNKQYMKQTRGWAQVCSVIWLIFLVWAVVLAMKVHNGPRKVEHIMFAILFPPVYVLAYYIASFGNEGGMGGAAPVHKTVSVGFV